MASVPEFVLFASPTLDPTALRRPGAASPVPSISSAVIAILEVDMEAPPARPLLTRLLCIAISRFLRQSTPILDNNESIRKSDVEDHAQANNSKSDSSDTEDLRESPMESVTGKMSATDLTLSTTTVESIEIPAGPKGKLPVVQSVVGGSAGPAAEYADSTDEDQGAPCDVCLYRASLLFRHLLGLISTVTTDQVVFIVASESLPPIRFPSKTDQKNGVDSSIINSKTFFGALITALRPFCQLRDGEPDMDPEELRGQVSQAIELKLTEKIDCTLRDRVKKANVWLPTALELAQDESLAFLNQNVTVTIPCPADEAGSTLGCEHTPAQSPYLEIEPGSYTGYSATHARPSSKQFLVAKPGGPIRLESAPHEGGAASSSVPSSARYKVREWLNGCKLEPSRIPADLTDDEYSEWTPSVRLADKKFFEDVEREPTMYSFPVQEVLWAIYYLLEVVAQVEPGCDV